MEYWHRVMIGAFGALGKDAGAESQRVANKVAYEVGKQIGEELLKRNLISRDMDSVKIVEITFNELKIGNTRLLTTPSGKVFDITDCNICPKKVGKYPIRATACPLPGIIKGVLKKVEKGDLMPYPELSPGEKCRIICPGEKY